MEKLIITNENGIRTKLDFDERFAKGIFITNQNRKVIKNCSVLKIHLEEPQSDLHLIQKVSIIGKTGIVSSRLDNDFIQYIIMPSAEREDFTNFLMEIPEEMHGVLYQAFNMRKMNTLKDFDLLGGPLSNSNKN